jgi:cyclopropane-fatty-acyl-phospholipid synthase
MTSTDSVRLAGNTPAIDPRYWPDVAVVPPSALRAAVAQRLFRHAVNRLPLRVTDSAGNRFGGGRPDDPEMHLVRPTAFYRRLGATGTIGFGEAFMAGDWTAEDLTGVLTTFADHIRDLVPPVLQRLRHAVLRKQPAAEDNTIDGARSNIHRHYDLSNEMFKEFLDDSMTYSSAIYAGDPVDSPDSLTEAQHRKVDRLLDATRVGPGSRVVEIGTGWGELAMRAAARGAQVTTLTISTEQAQLARQRLDSAGLGDRVDIRLEDYRQARGRYDAVLSVEMIEAVGGNHWPSYFATLDRLAVPGGRVGLQAIVQEDASMRATADTYTWIRKYIFPGGQLPSVESIAENIRQDTSLRLIERYSFGQHYAETLRRWRDRFEARAGEVARLGFDETFRRMWSLYLAYSEAGFRSGYLDVEQFTYAKPVVAAR